MLNRNWLCFVIAAVVLAACSTGAPLTPSANDALARQPQTLHAVAITSPTPTPLISQLLSPIITAATNLLPVCDVTNLVQASCGAIRRADILGTLGSLLGNIPGYHPSDLQSAYNLPSSTAGRGQTIGIVVAFDDPNAEPDLAVYRSKFKLGACTTTNGCLSKVGQTGAALPAANENWAQETSIDLDIASAVCPNCKLLLVEANSADMNDLAAAVQTAVNKGATVVSNSFSAPEQPEEASLDAQWNHPGVPIVAGAGDSGYGVGWPAASSHVIAVGGTTLKRSLTGKFTESVWGATGSGCSQYIAKPSWQKDTLCSHRTVSDVAADADPNTGVAVYDTYFAAKNGGWLVYGGTSVSTVIVAGAYALAGNGQMLTGASSIYAHTSMLHDIRSGNNGECGGSYLCTALAGFDGPSGWGSPNGVGAL